MTAPQAPRPGGLSEEALAVLRRLIDNSPEDCSLADGQVRVVRADLPDHAVVSIARDGCGTIWLIMDPNQPDTRRHLAELLAHWPEGVDEQVAGAVAHQVGLTVVPDPDDED